MSMPRLKKIPCFLKQNILALQVAFYEPKGGGIMTKRIFLLLIVFVIITGGIFSQEAERAKNTGALSFSFIGIGASYERMLTKHFSVTLDIAYTTLFVFLDDFTAAIKGRWYPGAKAFFLELGLGYGNMVGAAGSAIAFLTWIFTAGLAGDVSNNLRTQGLLVSPGLGWKFDPGKPNGIVIPVNLGIDIVFGPLPDVLPYARIGVGYSF
jgi:hypothetical protein